MAARAGLVLLTALAMHVGACEEFFTGADVAFFEFDGLGPQHGVGEVQRPLVRGRVGALRHEAQVPHAALIDRLPAVMANVKDALHLLEGGRFVVIVITLPVNVVPGGRFQIALAQRLACERSALARVSNQSATSSWPSSRAVLVAGVNGMPVAGAPHCLSYCR